MAETENNQQIVKEINEQNNNELPLIEPLQEKKDSFNQLISFINFRFSEKINGTKVHDIINTISKTKKSIADFYYFYSNKTFVNAFKKKYNNTLNIFGFNPEDFNHKFIKSTFQNDDEINQNMLSVLKKIDVNFDNELGFSSDFFENATDSVKIELIQKIFIPKITTLLSHSFELSQLIQEAANSDKYLFDLKQFSDMHQLNPDTVIHSLENNPNILKDKKDFIKLLINKEYILNNNKKFELLFSNNLLFMNKLTMVINDFGKIINQTAISAKEKKSILTSFQKLEISLKNNSKISLQKINSMVSNTLRTPSNNQSLKLN